MFQLKSGEMVAIKRALEKFEDKVREAMRMALVESRRESTVAAGEVHDLGDESVADELMELNSALAERHGREILRIERARQRIADGDINACSECAGDIGVQRLLANPVAERRISCEARLERSHARAAMPRM